MDPPRIKLAAETNETPRRLLLIFRPDTSHARLIIAGLTSRLDEGEPRSFAVKNYAETFAEASSHISKIIYH